MSRTRPSDPSTWSVTTELDGEGDAEEAAIMLRGFAAELEALAASDGGGSPDSFLVESGLVTLDFDFDGDARVGMLAAGETRPWTVEMPTSPAPGTEDDRCARHLAQAAGTLSITADLLEAVGRTAATRWPETVRLLTPEPDETVVEEGDPMDLRRLAMTERLSLIGAIAAGACGHGGRDRLVAVAPSPWSAFALRTTDGVDLPLDERTAAFADAAIPVCAQLTGTTLQGRRLRAVAIEAAVSPMGTAETMRLFADGPEALATRIASGWNPAA